MKNNYVEFGNLTIEQIEKLINFIEDASELQVGVTFSNNDTGGLYYNSTSESVNIPLNTIIFNDKLGKVFQNFIKESFDTDVPFEDLIIISVLHEIGHYMTEDDDLNAQRAIREYLIVLTLERGGYTEEQANKEYFGMPGEYQATEWAVKFYNYNKKMCQKLASIL